MALPSRARGLANQDVANLLLIALSAVLAHVWPEETLLGAYAFLGPAHYLTEISWLSDRKLFAAGGWTDGLPLVILALLFVGAGIGPVGCAALVGAMTLAVTIACGLPATARAAITALSTLGAYLLAHWGVRSLVMAALLIATIVHVGAFTAAFVVKGALRGSSPQGWSVVAALLLAGASFFLLHMSPAGSPATEWTLARTFSSNLEAARSLLSHTQLRPIIGLFAFCYLYHYLNWFSKTGAVGWHRVSTRRKLVLAGAWSVSTAVYLSNYAIGALVTLPLSVAHVFLEFPLNARTLGSFLPGFPCGRRPAGDGRPG